MVVVGGGPAGLALTSALASQQVTRDNLKIALVEGSDLSKVMDWSLPPTQFSNRVSSLTNASRLFLEDIGAWEHVDASRTGVMKNIEVWDGVSDARISFAAEDLPEAEDFEGMSQLTENLNLQRGLLRHLSTFPNIRVQHKSKVTSIEESNGWPLVNLDNGASVRTRLLVGADGFNSPVRTYSKIKSFGWSYDTQGIVATLEHAPIQNQTAYQRFLPTGPIAFLPISETASSMVWSTKPPLAAAILASDPSVLVQMINAAFRLPHVSMSYLHKRILEGAGSKQLLTGTQIQDEITFRETAHNIDATSALSSTRSEAGIPPEGADLLPPLIRSVQAGTPASFPLRFNHTESYLGNRTVLLGDAAHTVHPLAGQGLNLGLADADCLAQVIARAVENGADIGSPTALQPYAQERYMENHKMMGVFDKLHKLYSTDNQAVVALRSTGVEVLNELDTVKAALMLNAGARKKTKSGGGSDWLSFIGAAAIFDMFSNLISHPTTNGSNL